MTTFVFERKIYTLYIYQQFGNLEYTADDDLPLPVKVARGSAFALWSLSKSERNKAVIKKSGGLPLLAGYAIVLNRNILIYTFLFHYVHVTYSKICIVIFQIGTNETNFDTYTCYWYASGK